MAESSAGLSLPRDLNSTIRGYTWYSSVWPKPYNGEKLICQQEPDNHYDKNAIAVKKDGEIVGHVPKERTQYFAPYMQQSEIQLTATVTGDACDHPVKGLEIPCVYRFEAKARKRGEDSAHHSRKKIKTAASASSSEESDGLSEHDEMSTDEDDDLPNELENLDPLMIDMYLRALKEGKEKQNTVRLMVVGYAGVGKTTLTGNLLEIPTDGIESTNGIEVHKCSASSVDGKWKNKIDNVDTIERLVSVVSSLQASSSYDSSETHVTIDGQHAESLDHGKVKNTNESTSSDDTSEKKSQAFRLPLNDSQTSYSNRSTDSNKDSTMHDESHHSDETKSNQDSKKSNDNKLSKENVLQFTSGLNKEKTQNQDKLINIWDFGGQFVFYATHQLFLTRRAVYLLVFDISANLDALIEDEDFPEGTNKKSVRSLYKFWMHSIHWYVGSSEGEPPIILVGTHEDILKEDHKSKGKTKEKCFDNVRDLFDETPVLKHIQPKDFSVDLSSANKNSGKTLKTMEELRKYIMEVAKSQKSWNREIPAKWIPLENALKKGKRKHITFQEIVDMDSGNEVPIKDRKELELFLTYHHLMGTYVYFNEDGLNDFVILEPQWIIDAFKCIITTQRFCKVLPSIKNLWNELMKEAVLKPELIDALWSSSKADEFMPHKDKLLLCLSKLGIVSEVKTFDSDTKQIKKLGFFIVPSLLRSRSTKNMVDLFLQSRRSTIMRLVFSFENEWVSPTLYHQITAAAIGRWPVVKYKEAYLLFEDLGVYELPTDHVGWIEMTDKTIEIMVVNLCGNAVDCRESDRLRRFVEMVIKHELERHHSDRKRQYKLCVRCNIDNRGRYLKEIHLFERSRKPIVQCPDKIAGHNINVKAMLKEWFPDSKIDGIVDLLKHESGKNFDREVTEKEALQIAKAIVHNWEVLGIALEVSRAKREQIKMDHPHSSRLQVVYMLTTWMRQEADNATLERLLRTMEEEDDVEVNWDSIKNTLDKFPY